MKKKINKGVNPFSNKKNLLSWYDSNTQILKLYDYVTSVEDGNVTGALRFNTNLNASNKNSLVELLRSMFGRYFPYKNIAKYGSYVTYYCKDSGSKTKSTVRNELKAEVIKVLAAAKKARETAGNPYDPNAPKDGYTSEYFPLRTGMQGDKTEKLNNYLFKNGFLTSNQGANFTDETRKALKAYFKYEVDSLGEFEYNKMFEVKVTNTNSLLSGNNLYIIIAVVIAVAIFFFLKRKKQ